MLGIGLGLTAIRGGGSSDSPTPPPSCTITLTGDIAAVFGGQPMTINGQTASFIQTDPPATWFASTPPEAPFPLPLSGTSIVELGFEREGGTLPTAIIQGTNYRISCIYGNNDAPSIFIQDVITSEVVGWVVEEPEAGSITALGVDSDGTPVAFSGGTPLTFTGNVAGFLSGGVFLAATNNSQLGVSGSITFRTAGADFTQTYPAGTQDWCGNAIA